MQLNNNMFQKLVTLIDSSKKNKTYEFESRFWNKNNSLISEDNYTKIFQKLTFSKQNNGLGYKYEMKNILDVILDKDVSGETDNIRMSIIGEDNIKKYWLTSSLDEITPIFIEKEKLDKIDDDNYNIRFSLNNELPQNSLLEKNIDLLKSTDYEKVYRLKNRYTIKTDDNLFIIEMSKTKMGIAKSFRESNTLKERINYEIEIEFVGKDSDLPNETIAKKLLANCYMILKLLQNSNFIMSNNMMNGIKEAYMKLVGIDREDFIAASPVTIHRDNLFKSDYIKNIYNRYAVTLKADGERYFLFVTHPDSRIYLFNNSFKFIDTGYKDESMTDTLIEGEFIENNNEFYMYDILFFKGTDVRRRHLIDIHRDSKVENRIDLLDKFLKSTSRQVIPPLNESNCIKLYNKKYIQSVRGDGSDIFQKVKELWDARKYNSFHVDGVIFTPKYEYYPMRGGGWYSLFKWKPPELNTIDFLIKTLKDENGRDIKYPHIDVINRLDGKQETVLRQYKSFELYVSGKKTFYQNKKNMQKSIPVLFNPFGLDEKNSATYNIAKIFIQDDGKVYANDPLTNEIVEIHDDIIVEFGYDDTREEGFKWLPYRFRKDKTNLYKSGKEIFGNGEKTANDIFKAIQSPITEEMITTGKIPVLSEKNKLIQEPYYVRGDNESGKRERYDYQNFHNHYIKYQLLYFSSPNYTEHDTTTTSYNGKLLDLCCGNGADINKIKRAKYAEVVGIDIDFQNIKDAQERFKSIVIPPPKAYYVQGDTRKLIWPEQSAAMSEAGKIYMKKYIPTKYMFDTISLQFCFHYFFESEITFRSMLQNINDNLKIGGYVMGTTFDGERIYDALKSTDTISGKNFGGEIMWKIDKKYGTSKFGFTSKKGNFGKQIDVYIKTIGAVHPEYLVNFNYVDKMMEDYGFEKIFIKPFEEFHKELMEGQNLMDLTEKELEKDVEAATKMSNDEKRFSFLSSGFMYKKVKNSPDALMKKLVELMEKEHKVKGTKNVFAVDGETEHIIENIESI